MGRGSGRARDGAVFPGLGKASLYQVSPSGHRNEFAPGRKLNASIDPKGAPASNQGNTKRTKMKIRMFDSLGEDGARQLTGCKIIDESGKPIGTVEGLWMDSSTRR